MKINEIFYSLQGEGILIGMPTVFIRVTGCNLRCKWCDTKYAYYNGKEMKIKEIIDNIKKYPTKYICVTGGEPLLQNETIKLIDTLLNSSYNVLLETNGTLSLKPIPKSEKLIISMDIKTPSSSMQDKIDISNLCFLKRKDQVKFVILDALDYKYAKNFLNSNTINCNIIFQSVGGIEIKELAKLVMENGIEARVLPQLHKLLNMK